MGKDKRSLCSVKTIWKLSNSSSSLAYPCLVFTVIPDTYIQIYIYIYVLNFTDLSIGLGEIWKIHLLVQQRQHISWNAGHWEDDAAFQPGWSNLLHISDLFRDSQVCSVVVPGRAGDDSEPDGSWWGVSSTRTREDRAQEPRHSRRKPEGAVSRCGGAALALHSPFHQTPPWIWPDLTMPSCPAQPSPAELLGQ